MARTESTMKELGTLVPGFRLPDAKGRFFDVSDFSDARALLVVFWCNHCPYVKHIKREFSEFARHWKGNGQDKSLAIVAVNSNDIESYPSDSPERMLEDIKEFAYGFPYLVDADQSVARAFYAACTPDFFLYDANRLLVYRGQFDDARPRNDLPVTGQDLWDAVNAVSNGEPVPALQKPSMGCGIKWKEG